MAGIRRICLKATFLCQGKQNVAATQRSDLPKCPMITLNTTFLTDLEIFDAATNQTLSTESAGFEFIHGRLRGMFMIIAYGVKNIRVKATTDTTENVVASFNSFKTPLHCYQTKFLLSFKRRRSSSIWNEHFDNTNRISTRIRSSNCSIGH